MHFIGRIQNGHEFANTRADNQPFRFTLGTNDVIQGFNEGGDHFSGCPAPDSTDGLLLSYTCCAPLVGVAQMTLGERSILTIPPEHGYGARDDLGVR